MDLLSTAHIYNIIKKERRKGQNSVSMINNYTIQLCLSILAETDRYSCNWDCSEWLAISQSQTLRSFWRMCRFINGICSFRSDIIHSFFHFTVAQGRRRGPYYIDLDEIYNLITYHSFIQELIIFFRASASISWCLKSTVNLSFL